MKARFLSSVLIGLLAFGLCLALPALAQQADEAGTGPNYETRLAGLEDQMRIMNGRIEQLENATRKLDQAMQRLQTDLDARVTKLETAASAAPPLAQVPAKSPPPPVASNITPTPSDTAPNDAAPANGTLGDLKLQNGKVTGAINNPQAPPLPATPPDYGLTPGEQYDRAFSFLRQANYDEAEKAFKAFIDKNPKDKLIDNAKYWYGETLYVRGKFDELAIAFADAYQQNPQGAKAPDSLLKLAMSMSALQKTADACATLTELKSKYPSAPVTVRSRADQERTKLKCAATPAQ